MTIKITSDDFVNKIQVGEPFEIQNALDDMVHGASKNQFYAQTMVLYDLQDAHCTFCLVSAPGAMGKSALCNYISEKTNGVIWNLAQASIGDSFFHGTLAKSHGSSNLGDCISLIKAKKYTLILDALDEAEITSGWSNIETMLNDIVDLFPTDSNNQVVIVARSETIDLVKLYFDDRMVKYSSAIVQYFENNQIIDFCTQYFYSRTGGVIHERAKEVLNVLLMRVKNVYAENGDVDTQSSVNQFIGYAPVLQVITEYVIAATNVQSLLMSDTSAKEIEFIKEILDRLLRREQDKFVSAFQKSLDKVEGLFDKWETLYSVDEQVFNLLAYISNSHLFFEENLSQLPASYADEYMQKVRSFIPQHPFVLNGQFAGPAFKDYSLLCRVQTLKPDEQRKILQHHGKSISPLFWEFFKAGGGVVNRAIFGFLVESIMSSQKANEIVYINLYKLSKDGSVRFDVVQEVNGFIKRKEAFSLEDSASPIYFTSSLVGVSCNVYEDIVIDSPNETVKLCGTHIQCRNLTINARQIDVLDSEARGESLLLADECVYNSEICIDDAHSLLSIYWKDGNEYPWASYYSDDYYYTNATSMADWAKYLRSILGWFRKDRRPTLGKHKEMIDNVAVGSNVTKRKILEFLKSEKIITETSSQPKYFIAPAKLDKYGIGFNSKIDDGEESNGLKSLYERFLAWERN